MVDKRTQTLVAILVHDFCLSIRLGRICCGQKELYSKDSVKRLPESRDKLWSTIGNNTIGKIVITVDMDIVQFCHVFGCGSFVARDRYGSFAESVDKNTHIVVTLLVLRLGLEVHKYMLSRAIGNGKGMKKPGRLVSSDFRPSTNLTVRDVWTLAFIPAQK